MGCIGCCSKGIQFRNHNPKENYVNWKWYFLWSQPTLQGVSLSVKPMSVCFNVLLLFCVFGFFGHFGSFGAFPGSGITILE
uniref:Uncharacterized protein n=1 Tax=Rhizophora mucronata TaxID=61149 RepID=A0A2P2PIF0_RHIMU